MAHGIFRNPKHQKCSTHLPVFTCFAATTPIATANSFAARRQLEFCYLRASFKYNWTSSVSMPGSHAILMLRLTNIVSNKTTLCLAWIAGLWDAGDNVYWEIFVSHSELGTSRSNLFGKVVFCNIWHVGPWYTSRSHIISHDRSMRQCRTWSVILHVSKAMVSSGEKGLQWVWMPWRADRHRETQWSNVGMGQWYCRITVHIVHLDFRAKECSWLLICWEMFGKKHDDVLTFRCLFCTVTPALRNLYIILSSTCFLLSPTNVLRFAEEVATFSENCRWWGHVVAVFEILQRP